MIIVVAILTVTLLGVLGFIFWQKYVQSNTTTAENKDATTSTAIGTIEGSLTYPSDYIPPSMTIYAVNISTNKEYSTSEHLTDSKYKYGFGFKIEVPVGGYYLYALIDNGKESYYDQCTQNVYEGKNTCSSHDKVIVKVTENQTTSDIMAGY